MAKSFPSISSMGSRLQTAIDSRAALSMRSTTAAAYRDAGTIQEANVAKQEEKAETKVFSAANLGGLSPEMVPVWQSSFSPCEKNTIGTRKPFWSVYLLEKLLPLCRYFRQRSRQSHLTMGINLPHNK